MTAPATPSNAGSPNVGEGALLPCPFCGGLDAEFVNGADDDGTWVAVGCPDCGVGSRQHYAVMDDARPHAQNAWNTRATSPTVPAIPVDRLREVLFDGTKIMSPSERVQWIERAKAVLR